MNLSELQRYAKKWTDHNFPNAESWQPLLGVMEEAGELAHAHLKATQHIRVSEDFAAKKADAVGDIIIFLADYCNKNNLDLETCVNETWKEASKRDWIKYPTNGRTG